MRHNGVARGGLAPSQGQPPAGALLHLPQGESSPVSRAAPDSGAGAREEPVRVALTPKPVTKETAAVRSRSLHGRARVADTRTASGGRKGGAVAPAPVPPAGAI